MWSFGENMAEEKCSFCVKKRFSFDRAFYRIKDGHFKLDANKKLAPYNGPELKLGDAVFFFSCPKGHEKSYEYSFGNLAEDIDFLKVRISHEGDVKCPNCGNNYYHVEKAWIKKKEVFSFVCSRCLGHLKAYEAALIDVEKDYP